MRDTTVSRSSIDSEPGQAPLLITQRLSKVYGRGSATTTALYQCDLMIPARQILAVVGPSGSGKSTLLHLLAGIDRPTSGTVLLRGQDIHALSDHEQASLRAREMGFVLQRFNLIPSLTVAENAAAPLILAGVPRRDALGKATTLLERVGVAHRAAAFPDEVSGGEAQRAAVARACINSPALIFADEPTGSLDRRAGAEVIKLFTELVRDTGASAVLVTHDDVVADAADSQLRLLDGRVAAG